MQRLMMLVGVAVVAAAMYVAASSASQQSKAPTAKQFGALKKQVASLSKSLKTAKKEADESVKVIACFVSTNSGVLPVNDFGDTAATPTFGYLYKPSASGMQTFRTGLDVDPTGASGVWLQAVDPACVSGSGLSHGGSAGTRLHLLVGHGR